MPAAELTLEDTSPTSLADAPSTWKQQHAQTASKAVGTEPLQQRDTDTQTTDRSEAAVQATAGPHGATAKASLNAASVATFLERVGPNMLSELSVNADTARSAQQAANRRTASQEQPQCLFTLNAFSDGSSAAANARVNKHQLQVTSLSWSKTGQTLAASFGRYDVSGWCCTPGAVATWNLARLRSSGSSSGGSAGSPDRLIATDTCITCCAFHPAEPALLAGGTYNGEVVIWDLNRDDANAQVAKTDVLPDLRHREPIMAISWQFSGQEARRHGAPSASYRLFTLGADGRLLVWLWNQLGNPIYGYELRWMSPGRELLLQLGGSAFAFCPPGSRHEEAGLLLVGTEGGRLLHCQVIDMNEASLRDFAVKLEAAAAGSSKLELRSAVKDGEYQALAATVNALSTCPHHRQLALAAGGDGSLRVVDVLRSAPLLLLEPSAAGLMSAGWSPSRPLVFAAGSADGNVYLYDLAAKQRLIRPVAQLQVGTGSSSSSRYLQQQGRGRGSSSNSSSTSGGVAGVNALAYNSVVPSTLAAAAGDQIKVWRLPPWLSEARPGEAKLLSRLLDSEDVLGLLRKQGIVI